MTTTDSPGDAAPADWLPEVEERRRLALGLGGPERVQRQHDQGKFTIRERIEGVFDPASFHEIGRLAGPSRREDGHLVEVTPAPFIGGSARSTVARSRWPAKTSRIAGPGRRAGVDSLPTAADPAGGLAIGYA